MSTSELGQDARRSRRFRAQIDCDLTQGPTTTRVRSVDVSHHGVFLATKTPPRERFLVRVTLHLGDGPLSANAFVSRRVAPAAGVQSGVGVQFFAMPERSKKRWESYIQSLASSEIVGNDEDEGVASFMVKLPDVDKLREFFDRALRTNSLYMVTSALRPVGSRVAVVMVHPSTGSEFVLYGQISRIRAESPRGLEVHVDPLPITEHAAFGRFLLGEDPLAATPLPMLEPGDGSVEVPPYPHLPQVLRDSAPPPPPPGAPPPPPLEPARAVQLHAGGPALSDFDVPIEESFEWGSVGDEAVIDVDLSAIEGEDLKELQDVRGLRLSSAPSTRYEPEPPPPARPSLSAGASPPPRALPAPPPRPSAAPHPASLPPLARNLDGSSWASGRTPRPSFSPPPPPPPPPRALPPPQALAPPPPVEDELPSELVDLGSIMLAPLDPRLDKTDPTVAREPTVEAPVPGPRRVSDGASDAPPVPAPRRVHIPAADTDRAPLPAHVSEPSPKAAKLECRSCGDSATLAWGSPEGALAPFARYRLFHCRHCRRPVSVLRVASSQSRSEARAALALASVEPTVPIRVVYDVADLARVARCPHCNGRVTTPRTLDPLATALDRLPAETPLTRLRCGHCEKPSLVLKPG